MERIIWGSRRSLSIWSYLELVNQIQVNRLEILLFADKIKKINMFDWTQERIFVITTERIYNIKQ